MNLSQYVGTLNLLGDESRLRLVRPPARAGAQRDRSRAGHRHLAVPRLDAPGAPSRGRLRPRSARGHARVLRARPDYASGHGAKRFSTKRRARPIPRSPAIRSASLELDAERRGRFPNRSRARWSATTRPAARGNRSRSGIAALLDLGDVLDVGLGDGAAAGYLAPYCRSLTCIDTSARMIEAAKRAPRRHAHVRAQVADVHALPFRPASFDSVLLFHTLTYAEHPQRALEECARVLRPGGRARAPVARRARAARGHRAATASAIPASRRARCASCHPRRARCHVLRRRLPRSQEAAFSGGPGHRRQAKSRLKKSTEAG